MKDGTGIMHILRTLYFFVDGILVRGVRDLLIKTGGVGSLKNHPHPYPPSKKKKHGLTILR
jgi:hypothetical protein